MKRRHRDERGAIALMTALLSLALVVVAALAVDLGMQRVARSDMQSLADVVALDMSRELDGGRFSEYDLTALQADANLSRDRNDDTSVGRTPTVTPVLGMVDPMTGEFGGADDGDDVPDAVQVLAETEVDFAFGVASSGGAARTAVASLGSAACFQIGSYAASIEPGSSSIFRSLLGPLIGPSTLNLAGYNGLASADVALLDIIRAPSIAVGSVDELLSIPSLTAGDFFLALAHALDGQGAVLQADVLEAAALSVVAPMQIDIGELLGLSTATDAALATQFNALDLLVGAAFLADGDNLVGIPNLQAGLPSIGVTNTQLSIIERPQRACDDDEAKTAQLRLTAMAKLQLAIPLIKTPVVDLRLTDVDGKPSGEAPLLLDVDVAGARAKLTDDVTCDPDTFNAEVWTDLLTLNLSGSVHLKGSVKVTLNLGPLSLPTVLSVPVELDLQIAADASKPASTSPVPVQFVSPPQAYGTPVPVGPGDLVLPQVSIVIAPGSLRTGPVTVLGIPLSTNVLDAAVTPVLQGALPTIGATISPLVNPLISKVNAIVTPLAAGMGLNLAGADFFGLPEPTCSAPSLVG